MGDCAFCGEQTVRNQREHHVCRMVLAERERCAKWVAKLSKEVCWRCPEKTDACIAAIREGREP